MYRQHYGNKEDIRVPRDTLMMLGSASHCLLVISINLPKMTDVVQSIYYNIRCSLVVLESTFARKIMISKHYIRTFHGKEHFLYFNVDLLKVNSTEKI